MELTKNRVYEDIAEIRETIECSKKKYSGLYTLLLGYGLLQAIFLLLDFAGAFFWGAGSENAVYNFATGMTGAALAVVLYLTVYNREKHTSNRYYLAVMGIWGILAVAVPFMMFVARIFLAFVGNASVWESYYILREYEMAANMLLVCAAAIMVGYIIDRKGLCVLALLPLLCFMILRVFPVVQFTFSVKADMQIQLTLSAVFYYMANIGGYTGLGFLLKRQEKKRGNI